MLSGDVVAHLEMLKFIWVYVVWRCGGSFRDVMVHLVQLCLVWRCGGSFGDVVAYSGEVKGYW